MNEGSGSHVRVIASAGVAEWRGGDSIIGLADDAVCRAKETGRNRV
jgi:PleD family two-component response regulator